jgi:DNA repair protein RadC
MPPSAALRQREADVTGEKEAAKARREALKRRLAQGDNLSEVELMELILAYGAPRRDSAELFQALSERFGGLDGLLSAPREALEAIEEMPESTLALLELVACLRQRCVSSEKNAVLRTTEEWVDYLRPLFLRQRRERIYLLCLSRTGRLRTCEPMGEGSDSLVQLDVEQVCAVAKRSRAKLAVLAHSHPSGMAMPSQEDILTTRVCRDALEKVGVRLLDHLVFTDEDCVSMAESGML